MLFKHTFAELPKCDIRGELLINIGLHEESEGLP